MRREYSPIGVTSALLTFTLRPFCSTESFWLANFSSRAAIFFFSTGLLAFSSET